MSRLKLKLDDCSSRIYWSNLALATLKTSVSLVFCTVVL